MSINVQFFASLRELLDKQQIDIPFEASLTVNDVWIKAGDGIAMPDNTLCAINMEYVKPDTQVNDGDEVAFFPPVTGG